MKIGRISKPVVISTTHQPISVMVSVEQVGAAPLTQSVNQVSNEWDPDRTLNPLVLNPVVSACDPETGHPVLLTPTISWQLARYNKDGGEQRVLITAAYDPSNPVDYAVTQFNQLVVRRNVSPGNPVVIVLSVAYTDPTSGRRLKKEEYVTLSSANSPDPTYTVEILTENVVRYNPLDGDFLADDPSDAGSAFTFKAVVRRNGEICTDNVYIEWWASSALSPDIIMPINDEESIIGYEYTKDHPGYVMGQGGSTLMWDARFDKKTTIQVLVFKDAMSLDEEVCSEVRTLIWDSPKVKGDVLPLNGRAVRPEDQSKSFRLMLRTRTNDLSDAATRDMFQTVWKREDTNGRNQATIGTGREVTVTAESLRRTGNGGVLVMPEVTMRGPLEQVVVNGVDVVMVVPEGGTPEVDGRPVFKSRYTE